MICQVSNINIINRLICSILLEQEKSTMLTIQLLLKTLELSVVYLLLYNNKIEICCAFSISSSSNSLAQTLGSWSSRRVHGTPAIVAFKNNINNNKLCHNTITGLYSSVVNIPQSEPKHVETVLFIECGTLFVYSNDSYHLLSHKLFFPFLIILCYFCCRCC